MSLSVIDMMDELTNAKLELREIANALSGLSAALDYVQEGDELSATGPVMLMLARRHARDSANAVCEQIRVLTTVHGGLEAVRDAARKGGSR